MAAKKLSLDEQVRLLQKFGNPDFMRNCALVLALICCACFGLAYYTRELFFAMLGLMFMFIGFSSRRLGRNAIWAAKAWRVGNATSGEVDIAVKTDDESTSYTGLVRDTQHRTWQMQFGKPPWDPAPGKISVKLYYIQEAPWPVLIVAPAGLLVPARDPQRRD